MISPTQLVPPNPSTTRAHLVHLSYDPHHKRIAYAANNSIFIRPVDPTDVKTVPTQFTGHGAASTTVALFAPNGNYIASGDATGVVKIWDCAVISGPAGADRDPFAQPHVKSEFPIIAGPIKSIAWDADSTRVIAVGEGKEKFGRCFTWDLGNSIGEIQGHSGTVHAISIKPTRPYRAAGGGDDKLVVFYQGPPFKFDKTLKHHTNTVRDVKFSPQGSYFVSVGSDRSIILYDAKTGDVIATKNQAHNGGIYAVSWLDDGQFVTALADGSLRQWKADALENPVTTYVVAEKPLVEQQQLGVVVAGEWVVLVGYDGYLYYFTVGDLAYKHVVKGHQKLLTAVAIGGGTTIATGSADGTLFTWRVEDGKIAPLPVAGNGHGNYVVDIVATNHGLQSVGWDDKLVAGENLVQLPEQPRQAIYDDANDKVIVIGEKLVAVVDAATQAVDKVVELSFSATGGAKAGANLLVLDGTHNQVVVFEGLAPGAKWAPLRAAPVIVRVSPNGEYAAVADSFGKYTVYNVSDGTVVTLRWAFHSARVFDAQWSSDSKYLISGGLDCQVIVYSIERPAKLIKFPLAHQSGVLGIRWLDYKQGKFVTIGLDGVIKQWVVKFE